MIFMDPHGVGGGVYRFPRSVERPQIIEALRPAWGGFQCLGDDLETVHNWLPSGFEKANMSDAFSNLVPKAIVSHPTPLSPILKNLKEN